MLGFEPKSRGSEKRTKRLKNIFILIFLLTLILAKQSTSKPNRTKAKFPVYGCPSKVSHGSARNSHRGTESPLAKGTGLGKN